MEQRVSVNSHLFNFKLYEQYSQLSFKLRFSPLFQPFAPKFKPKMTEVLKNYNPAQVIWSRKFSPLKEDNFVLNQNINFIFPIKTDLLGNIEGFPPKIVVELFITGLEGTKLIKKYPPNGEGFSNMGHNLLSVSRVSSEVHEHIELVFDDVIFCTSSLVVHCQTISWMPRGVKHNLCGNGNQTILNRFFERDMTVYYVISLRSV